MDVKSMCLFLAVICVSYVSAYFPNYTILDAKAAAFVQNIIHNSREIEGHDLATLYGMDFESGTHKRLTKRDVQVHAAHSYTDKRLFTFQFASGERVRMSLVKQSVVTSDTKIAENFPDRREEYFLQSRDCYFLGSVEQENAGYASLGFCSGQVKGAFQTSNRTYEIYSLPESADRHKRSADMHVLVTWKSLERVAERLGKGIDPHKEFMELEVKENIKTRVTRSVEDGRMELETGIYLNKRFIDELKKVLGVSTTDELIDHTIIKWGGVYGVFSNPIKVGWNLVIKLLLIEIWRQEPPWFKPKGSSLGYDLSEICGGTNNPGVKFDHITMMTSGPSDGLSGLAFVDAVCSSGTRCAVSNNPYHDHLVEAHELGHNLGLPHDDPKLCKGKEGFMGGSPLHFLPCYHDILNRTLRTKKCLFRDDIPSIEIERQQSIFPGFMGQNLGFDKQCKAMNRQENFEFMVSSQDSHCEQFTCVGADPSKSSYGRVTQEKAWYGTPCGEEKMCDNRLCIDWNTTSINPALQRNYKVKGCWGPWSEFSPCSRTCGTGVKISSRKCWNPEPFLTPFCAGNMYIAELCIGNACPNELPTMKEPQLVKILANATCSSKPKDSNYRLTGEGDRYWSSGVLNKCTIRCYAAEGKQFWYLAMDGTPCNGSDTSEANNTLLGIRSWNCVRGQCRAFNMAGETLPDEMNYIICAGSTIFDYTENVITLCSAYIVVFFLWHLVPGILKP